MELPSNTLLQKGKYKIIKKLGQGGFGIAYKAYHQSLQREVCIKEFFFSDLCERARNSSDMTIISTSAEKIQLVTSFKKKFIKEAQRLAKFQHPNIVQVMDNFDENNTAYFVMEYLEGGSLEELLIHEGTMTEQKAIETISPIINAMETVHKDGLLHLDIKPANIMLRKNRTPVLIDFGISKYMELAGGYTTTAPVGISKGYAPLEQYGGEMSDFSKATDIYSICATLYRMVTGVTPPEPLQIIVGRLKSPLEFNSLLSEEFNKAILKGLSVRASDRQQSILELRQQLDIYHLQNIKTKINKLDKYSDIGKFVKGFSKVESNKKWGFIDKNGCQIVNNIYDYISDFFDGYAIVKINDRYGIIDYNLNEVVPIKYKYIFSNEYWDFGSFWWSQTLHRDSNSMYSVKISTIFSDSIVSVKTEDNLIAFWNKNGNEMILDCSKWDISEGLFFRDGLAEVKQIRNSKFGFINKLGQEIIPTIYDSVSLFSDGMCKVKLDGKYGFINKTGDIVIPCIYKDSHIDSFNEGLALLKNKAWDDVQYKDKQDFINRSGQKFIYEKGEWAFVNKKRQKVIYGNSNYDYIGSFSDSLCKVGLNREYGFIDKTGKEVIPCKFAKASDFSNGLAVALKRANILINKSGNEITNNLYQAIGYVIDGMIIVQDQNDKYGLIDTTGCEIIKCKYNKFNKFSEGLADVQFDGKYGYINKYDQEIIPFIYDNALNFSDGLAKVKKDGNWFFIDKTGKVVLE